MKFNKQPKAYIKALESRGFEVIGEGSFSCVLSKDNKKVIKVLHSSRQFDPWPEYILWATKNKKKFTPKLYSLKRYPNFYVAIVERVKEIPPRKRRGLDTALYEFNKTRKYGSLRKHLEELRKWSLIDDLGWENMGMRRNGSLVILDPVAFAPVHKSLKPFSKVLRYKMLLDQSI